MFAPTEVLLFAILAVIYQTNAQKLPSYITPCSRDQKTIKECATNEARKALPTLLNGDKSLKIPSLKPLRLPAVSLETGGNLAIKLTDVVISGFEDFDLKSVDINQEKHTLSLDISFTRLNLVAQYDITGSILILPISGSGPTNITFIDANFNYKSDIHSEKRGDQEYLKLINPSIEYTTKRSYFYLDNLFDGDKILGEQMNNFLDENWQEVNKELGPALADAISTIASAMINSMLNNFSRDVLFKP